MPSYSTFLRGAGPAAILGGGAAAAVGQPSEANAAPYDQMVKVLGKDLADRLAKVSAKPNIQDTLGNMMKRDYPKLVETGEFGGQTLQNKVAERAAVAADLRGDQDPLAAASLLKQNGLVRGNTEEETKALIQYNHLNNPEFLGRSYTPENVEAIKKWAGIGGIAGAVLGTNDEAEAFPLGRLTGALSKVDTKASRHQDAFSKLFGRTLNLQGPHDVERQPYQVVDVLKKGKEDFLVQVTNAEGQRMQLPMTSDYLNVLLGAHGTQAKLGEFQGKRVGDKLNQAIKGLNLRQVKRESGSLENYDDFKAWNASQASKAAEIDPALVNDYRYFQAAETGKGEETYLPTAYADLLHQRGYGKVIEKGPNPGNRLSQADPPEPFTRTGGERLPKVTDAQMDAKARSTNVEDFGKPKAQPATEDQKAKAHKLAIQYHLSAGERPTNAEYQITFYNILDQVVKGIR